MLARQLCRQCSPLRVRQVAKKQCSMAHKQHKHNNIKFTSLHLLIA